MKLDSRILEGKKPLNCFDTEQAKQFIGKKCYFSDDARDFMDLDKADGDTLFYVAELQNIWTAEEYCFADNSNDYRFILPLEWLKEEKTEPKYRPFTGIEFAEKFNLKLNSIIHLRGVPTNDHPCYNYKVVFTGYRWCDDVFQVFLNGSWLDLSKLLELYEYEENGEWHKFGVEE